MFRLFFFPGTVRVYDFKHSVLLRQCHCVAQMETYSRVHKEMYSTILISTLLHIYLKFLQLCCETLRRNVFYDMLTPQHTFFSSSLSDPRMLGLCCSRLSESGVPKVGLVQLPPHVSPQDEVPLRTCHQRSQLSGWKNRAGFFTALYFVRQNTAMCRATPWEQLHFHPLFTHPAWA